VPAAFKHRKAVVYQFLFCLFGHVSKIRKARFSCLSLHILVDKPRRSTTSFCVFRFKLQFECRLENDLSNARVHFDQDHGGHLYFEK
jgi:hypothetical protein